MNFDEYGQNMIKAKKKEALCTDPKKLDQKI